MNTDNVKTYTNRSNAKRAIKANSSNGYALAVANEFMTPIAGGFLVDLNAVSEYERTARENFAKQEQERAEANTRAKVAKTAKAAKAEKPVKIKVQGDVLRESSVLRPCKQVFHIADSMQGASRKEVIEACVNAGIAFNTARTQYQNWSSVQKEMAARVANSK